MVNIAKFDHTAFSSPLFAVGSGGVGQTENRGAPHEALLEPSSPQADESHPSPSYSQTPDEPTWIPSDAGSDVDDSDDSDDCLDTDDSHSDDALPSVNTLATTSKALSSMADKDSPTIEQRRSDSTVGTEASHAQPMPSAMTTPQEDKASQDDAGGSRDHADFVPTGGAAADPDAVPTTPEAGPSRQSSLSTLEGRSDGMKDGGSRCAEARSS
ncbi:hypothetical protein DL768_009459 [Monosporascus sp. mg162]|nr:hypothetical protein DL768_009459 [Monosporascus sp. mg162]